MYFVIEYVWLQEGQILRSHLGKSVLMRAGVGYINHQITDEDYDSDGEKNGSDWSGGVNRTMLPGYAVLSTNGLLQVRSIYLIL